LSESNFRVLSGILLSTFLFYGERVFIIYFCAYLFVEFITNIRLTSVVSSLRGHGSARAGSFTDFDSERVLRLAVVMIVGSACYVNNTYTWAIPWFVALMLMAAGVTRICPMKMGFAWLGLK
jgi:hypothetical protein